MDLKLPRLRYQTQTTTDQTIFRLQSLLRPCQTKITSNQTSLRPFYLCYFCATVIRASQTQKASDKKPYNLGGTMTPVCDPSWSDQRWLGSGTLNWVLISQIEQSTWCDQLKLSSLQSTKKNKKIYYLRQKTMSWLSNVQSVTCCKLWLRMAVHQLRLLWCSTLCHLHLRQQPENTTCKQTPDFIDPQSDTRQWGQSIMNCIQLCSNRKSYSQSLKIYLNANKFKSMKVRLSKI